MFSKNEFIEFMISAGALRFGDFVTKSGRNTPYFINTGNYSTGHRLAVLGGVYAELIENTCGTGFDALFGPAYKGIPLAAAVSIALYTSYGVDKPFFFNRKEAKDHGERGSFIGHTPVPGEQIIIIEDVVTAGTALRESMALLSPIGVEVTDMFISVDRCEKGYNGKTAVAEIREEFGIAVHAVVTIKDIVAWLKSTAYDAETIGRMEKYMELYCNI